MDSEVGSKGASVTTQNHYWRWAGASRQGQNHVLAQIDCQDAHRVRELPGGILVVAVADGAGSAPRSRDGATAAVDNLCDFLDEFLLPDKTTEADLADLLKRAFIYVSGVLRIVANHDEAKLSDYHTTLACAVVTRASLAVAHIGDGAVVCWDHPDKPETIARPEHGEYANSTFFVSQLPEQLDRLHIKVMARRCQGVALTTDGLLEIAFENPYGDCQPWVRFFEPLIERVRTAPADKDLSGQMDTFLSSPKIRDSTTDDLTLVIAVRQDKPNNSEVTKPSANIELETRRNPY